MRLQGLEKAKPITRRLAWIANQLFWQHAYPNVIGLASGVVKNIVAVKVLPKTSSPLLSEHLFRVETVDGAVIAGTTQGAWAKYAIPKGLPTNGQKTLAIENEPHRIDDFSGNIERGYGKGVKTLLYSGTAIAKVHGRSFAAKVNYHVHEAERAGKHYDIVVEGIHPGEKQWELNIPRGEYKGRYAFVTTSRGMIVTPMKDNGVRMPKPDYTLRKEELLEALNPANVIVERKIDGSLGNAAIGESRVTFRSHRDEGETYYDKLPAIEFITNQSPFLASRFVYSGPSITGTVFQGELAHQDGAGRVSGILNSLAPNARAIQQQRGPVRYYVWDILKYKGRDVSRRPYEERRVLAKQLVREIRQVNKFWDIVEEMGPNESPKEFYARVISDPLPWGEGVVIKPRQQALQRWDKLKVTGFNYFKLHEILEGEGKYGRSVGKLVVENPENGARGEVGSLAVPDEYRDWMWRNRDALVGQSIKVRSQEVTSRGVPRAGVFYGFHNSEVDLLMAAEAAVAGTDRPASEVVYAMKSAAGWRRK